MERILRVIHLSVAAFLLPLSPTITHAAQSSSNSPAITNELANCMGKFTASRLYETYIDGFTTSKSRTTSAFDRLLGALQVEGVGYYNEKIAVASGEFTAQIYSDPLEIRPLLTKAAADCDIVVKQAEALSNSIDRRTAEASEARIAERNARLRAEKNAQDHAFALAKLQAETEQKVKVQEAEERKARASADLLRAEDVARDKKFEQEKTLATLAKEEAQAKVETAKLEKAKAEALAQAAKSDKEKAQILAGLPGNQPQVPTANGEPSKAIPVNFNGSSAASAKFDSSNLLEAAIAPGYGTKAAWDTFVDEGGINKYSNFLGVPLKTITPGFDDAGRLIGFEITFSSTTISAKELRKNFSALCNASPSDWTIENNDGFRGGQIKRPGCHILYNNVNDRTWSLLYSAIPLS